MADLLSSAFANFVGNRKASVTLQQQQQRLAPPPVLTPSQQLPPPQKKLRYAPSIPLSSPVSIHSTASPYPIPSSPPSPSTSLISQPTTDPLRYSYSYPTLQQQQQTNNNYFIPITETRKRSYNQIDYVEPSSSNVNSSSQPIPNQPIINSIPKSYEIPTSSIKTHNQIENVIETPVVNKQIPCPHCNLILPSEKALQQHKMKSHERPFGCKITGCYASFSKQNHLSRHIRIVHNKERPFACMEPGCGSRFGSKSHLGDHTRAVHMRLRNFKCTKCNASWSKRFNLEKHYRIRHLGEKPFKCALCHLSFGTRSHVTRHEIKVHKKQS